MINRDLIKYNAIPPAASKISAYDSDGNLIVSEDVTRLKQSMGTKLYSFGALSDIHLQSDTAQEDFQKALTYLNQNESVSFTCVCGDLTNSGSDTELNQYKAYVDTYSPSTPVYSISGNHEGRVENVEGRIQSFTGNSLYYTFTHRNDVFIMLGIISQTLGGLFASGELDWLESTLEANKSKRVFLFQHVRPNDACGNSFGIYNYNIWGSSEATRFESLLKKYRNVIFFHSHSHLKFDLQKLNKDANVCKHYGMWDLHIPSLSVPRKGDASGASSREEIYADSEGYVVDVYDKGILLKGRDFVKDKYIPLAYYWLET